MKIGDKIKCINDKDSNSLYLNETYRITDINQYGNIQVAQSGSEPLQHYYKPSRFELAENSQKAPKTIDLSKKYKTRDGREVKLFAISDDSVYPVVGQANDDGNWNNDMWTLEGKIFSGSDKEEYSDLVEVIDEIVFSSGDNEFTVHNDLSINIKNLYNGRIIAICDEEMDGLIEAYNRMKQCNS